MIINLNKIGKELSRLVRNNKKISCERIYTCVVALILAKIDSTEFYKISLKKIM